MTGQYSKCDTTSESVRTTSVITEDGTYVEHFLEIAVPFIIMETVTMFTYTEYSGFCPYSKKDNIPTKLFTWLIMTEWMNIPLIFPFTCRGFSGFPSAPVGTRSLQAVK